MPRKYPPELRRQVLDRLAEGHRVARIAREFRVSDQTVYNWWREERHGRRSGTPALPVHAELAAALRRIAELESQLAAYRRLWLVLGRRPRGAAQSRPGSGRPS
jgi:transposase-like protein